MFVVAYAAELYFKATLITTQTAGMGVRGYISSLQPHSLHLALYKLTVGVGMFIRRHPLSGEC